MSQIQTFSYQGIGIEFELINGQVYANATAMFRANNARLDHWKDAELTRRYLQAVTQKMGIGENQLIVVRRGGNGPQGTWIHERLILNAARYCSVEFEIWCDDRIGELAKEASAPALPQSYKDALRALLEKEEERERLEAENLVLRPKAEYADLVLSSESELTTTLIAKELGMSAVALNRRLKELRIQYKQGESWVLYQPYQDKQYARLRTHTYADTTGRVRTSHYLVWTEAGRQFIHQRVRNGYGAHAQTAQTQTITA